MHKIISIFILLFVLLSAVSFASPIPYPTIFVHGIGDSSVAWKVTGPKVSSYCDKYYKTENHPYFSSGSGIGDDRDDKDFSDNLMNSCVYVTFKDYYDSPDNQVKELKKVIDDTREEVWENFPNYFKLKENIKVNLVAHSMGGLVCRKYITEYPKDHYVNTFITIDTPNTGTPALHLKWAGYILDILLHLKGIRLLSPAADSMHVDSKFLKELNSQPLPEDIKYRAIISNSTGLLQRTGNFIFGFRQGGDGGVPVESQGLKYTGIPNFEKLDYKEYIIDSPHFEAPTRAAEVVKLAIF